MMQCIAQALPVSSRKASGGKGSDTLGPLLALPHFDQDVVKKLRKQRVNAVKGAARAQTCGQTGQSAALNVLLGARSGGG